MHGSLNRPKAFTSLGDMLVAAIRASQSPEPDSRLVPAAASGASEGIGASGGYLVPEAFADGLIASGLEGSVLAPLVDRRTPGRGRTLKLPAIDERSRADGSRWGGVKAYWTSEAGQKVATKPQFGLIELEANKITVLVWLTDELLDDAAALEQHVRKLFDAEAGFLLDIAIVAGSGVGEPLGMLNGPALITVPKSAGQAADTLNAQNVRDLWRRLPVASRRRAVWIANEDVETALIADGTPAFYRPAGSVPGSPFATLFGRPIIELEQAPGLGDKGDLILADLSQYLLLDLGARSVLSADVRFIQDETVLRFVWRLDGAPGWLSPVTPYRGGAARSPFVALAERA